jgi:hypothetical protein
MADIMNMEIGLAEGIFATEFLFDTDAEVALSESTDNFWPAVVSVCGDMMDTTSPRVQRPKNQMYYEAVIPWKS